MADTGGGRRPIELIRQQKQANRHAMLDAAAALFAASGFAGTTMEAVAARSGMSVQSVYFAFGTKAALLRAAIERLTPPPSTRPVDRDPDRVLKALVEERVRGLDATGALVLAAASRLPRRWFGVRVGTVALALTPVLVILPLTSEGGTSSAATLFLRGLTVTTLALVLVGTSPRTRI